VCPAALAAGASFRTFRPERAVQFAGRAPTSLQRGGLLIACNQPGAAVMSDPGAVNRHYLDRVVAAAGTTGVEATDDIVSGSGMKLVAKGTRIDAHTRERLLQHKLRKPLEHSVRLVAATSARDLDAAAERLTQGTAFLACIGSDAATRAVRGALRSLHPALPLAAVIDLYAAQGPDKLDHVVAVALIAAALWHDLPQGGPAGVPAMVVASLTHDIGELYIDPAIVQSTGRLTPDQWRHIATHPLVGAHVLRSLPGAGPGVADAVLHHHERLDGFGYPNAVEGGGLPFAGQVLAFAEMLAGLLEGGAQGAERVAVVARLIPGEFDRHLLGRAMSAAKAAVSTSAGEGSAVAPSRAGELVESVTVLRRTLQSLSRLRAPIEAQSRAAGPALVALMDPLIARCQRIRLAFSSTGLDIDDPVVLREWLEAMDAAGLDEISMVVHEIEWHLREVKREARTRAVRLAPDEAAQVFRFVDLAKECAATAMPRMPQLRPA